MILKNDHTYRDQLGNTVYIYCDVGNHPGWCQSTAGDWYERATGKHVWWTPERDHYVCKEDSLLDLIEEVAE